MTAVAVLLARGGSKGIPGKNLRPVGGVSLVGRSVRAALAAKSVAGIYVSTDDKAIADEARRHGGRVIDRPADISGDTATSESGWLHALGLIRNDHAGVDRLVLLQCTSPFTTGADIDGCLAAMEKAGAACSLSVIEDHSFIWTRDAGGFGIGVNHDEKKQRQRRQELPPAFRESGAIYCVDVAAFEKVGRRTCGKVALFEVDHPNVEIDSVADLELCDVIARQRDDAAAIGADVRSRLKAVRAVIMDFDGVHTDDTVTVDENGKESVRASRSDGMGIELLRRAGRYKLVIVSKETNGVVGARAAKIKVECLQAIEDKVASIETWLAAQHLNWSDVLYVGNDVNDLGPLSRALVAVCPQGAHPSAASLAHWVVPRPGGSGVLRAIADALLADG
jgi:N-acylneuraminate cytidylyltransferase